MTLVSVAARPPKVISETIPARQRGIRLSCNARADYCGRVLLVYASDKFTEQALGLVIEKGPSYHDRCFLGEPILGSLHHSRMD